MRIMRIAGDADPWTHRTETYNSEYGSQLGHCFDSHLGSLLGVRRCTANDERGAGRPIVVRGSRAGSLSRDVGARSAATDDARLAVVCCAADDSRSGVAVGRFLARTE